MLTNVYAKTYIIKDCKKNKANVMYNFVKANYEYQDVTWHIDWLNQCDQSKPKLLNEKDADEFRQISLDAEANYLFEKAEALSYYHDSNKELNDYTEFTKMHNLKFNQVKNENAVEGIKKRQLEKKLTKPEDCSDVNIKDKFPKVRNQDSVGWCYAFVAADMISYKAGFNVSAADIAVNYSQKFNVSHEKRKINQGELHEDVEGGWTAKAIENAAAKGICKESDSPSEYFVEDKDIGDFIKSAEDPFSQLYSPPTFLDAGSSKSLCLSEKSPFLNDLHKVITHSQPNNIMYQLNEKRCEGKRLTLQPDKYAVEENKGPKVDLIKSIHETLNKKNPASIGYNVKFLKDERTEGNHASIVVGRRYNQEANSCQFLIRNSWGSGCKNYAEPYSLQENCNDGHIWVPEETLHQNIYRVVNFKN